MRARMTHPSSTLRQALPRAAAIAAKARGSDIAEAARYPLCAVCGLT